MCLILFAVAASADYPLVIAANRDEFFVRQSAPAAFWDGTGLLAGRDLLHGGSWFGVTRGGRLAMVTNVRSPQVEHSTRSRGALVRDFLLGEQAPDAFMAEAVSPEDRYPGFNLVLGDIDRLCYGSNRGQKCTVLEPGIHGLSNAGLDTPWPKVTGGCSALHAALASTAELETQLFALLGDRSIAPDDQLPDTGVGLDWERTLSARFIHGAAYGTRASTLLLVDRQRRGRLVERSFDARGECFHEARFDLQF